MLSNYLNIAWRNILRNKTFSVINILGLSLGMCTCFFGLTYVRFELSYDTYHTRADHIYRLVTDVKTANGTTHEGASAPMAPALQLEFPEVKAAARVCLDYFVLRTPEQAVYEENVAYADSSAFSVFTLPLISGDPKTALTVPFSLILSESAAHKYFGAANPMGKTLLLDGKMPASVTGVMRDMPRNSHFRVDILVSMATLLDKFNPGRGTNWAKFDMYTYLLLPDGYDPASLSAKLPAFVGRHFNQQTTAYTLFLEPLTWVYLHGKPRGSRFGSAVVGNEQNVYIVSLAAILVLLVAGFNYINFSTAVATQRTKEVGVRRILGALKRQLIWQFFTEALLTCLMGLGCALALCVLLLPLFNQVAGKIVIASILDQGSHLGVLLLIAVVTCVVAGLYPAFFLSARQPVGSPGGHPSNRLRQEMRHSLVVTQFTVAIILTVATLVVYEQIRFMQTNELGFKKAHRLVVDFHYDERIYEHEEATRNQLAALPGVGEISITSCIPGRTNNRFNATIETAAGSRTDFLWDAYFIDYAFLKQYQIRLIAGRDFSRKFATDLRGAMILNETAVRKLGYTEPQQALGKWFQQGNNRGVIVGVINDFHFHSLRERVDPLMLLIAPGRNTFITLDIYAQDVKPTIDALAQRWQVLAPDLPLSYFFADEAYNAQYQSEEQFATLFMYLTALSIILSCLGLFGLVAFTAGQRTKEIGVRKVLGASVTSIVTLLSKDFLKLVLIAILIASPIAWYAMNAWLQGFAYKITIGWGVFALAGALAVGIALLTVSFQSIRAALMNPVKSLRSE